MSYNSMKVKISGTTNLNAVKDIRITKSSDKDVLHDSIIKYMAVSQPFLFVQMSSRLCKSCFCPWRMVPKNFNLPCLRHCLCKNLKWQSIHYNLQCGLKLKSSWKHKLVEPPVKIKKKSAKPQTVTQGGQTNFAPQYKSSHICLCTLLTFTVHTRRTEDP